MKPITTLITVLIGLNCFSQSGLEYDVEVYTMCVVDSVSPSSQKQIIAIYDYNRKVLAYYNDQTLTVPYTPTGTIIPCFDIVGVSECRLRAVSNSSNKRKWTLDNSDVSGYHDDIFLSSILYEEFLGEGVGPGKKNVSIPLNYPYGNTSAEATRFTKDLKAWLECKSVHYIDSSTWALPSTYALAVQIHTVRNNFDINLDQAIYSINLSDPTQTYITKSGGNTVVNSISTFEVCEVYRKEKNGAVYYIMPYYNTSPLYPNDASFGLLGRRVDCNYQSARGADCDRPASQNCYLAKSDSMLCTYNLYIATPDSITGFWTRGGVSTGFGGTFYSTVQPDHKQLQDTLQKWLYANNYYGRVSVQNSKHSSAGWNITIEYTDCVFDSLSTNRGNYSFNVIDCKDYFYYDVVRNELGGIINTIDEYGRNLVCPPEAAIMVPCDQLQNIGGCRYKGLVGSFIITTTTPQTFNLGNYSSFNAYQQTGTGTLTVPNGTGGTSNILMAAGTMWTVKSEQKCKYLAKNTVKYTLSNTGTCIVNFTY